ncbi:MAG: succinate dehydrogenase / fumarate reductase membrane anchor subunit [Gammaproteobacteria bacterium]|jgi:succinate dehydrogenase / fumarate reductase membrane anchor subunit
MSNLRTPLSQAKGLGSAKEGTTHFLRQRLTALLMIPLILWLGFGLAAMPVDHATLIETIQNPAVTVGLIVLIMATFYHAQLGLQVIIEDYVSTKSTRLVSIILVTFLCLLLGVVGVVSVLKIALGA